MMIFCKTIMQFPHNREMSLAADSYQSCTVSNLYQVLYICMETRPLNHQKQHKQEINEATESSGSSEQNEDKNLRC